MKRPSSLSSKSTLAQASTGNNNSSSSSSSSGQQRRPLGYSVDELVDRLSRMYSLGPSRAFERKVVVALKRGVDYGILFKSRNRYRYDPERSLKIFLRRSGLRKRRKPAARAQRQRRGRVSASKATSSASSASGKRPRVPRPTVPPPPRFQPPPRNLTREPFSKAIKHCLRTR